MEDSAKYHMHKEANFCVLRKWVCVPQIYYISYLTEENYNKPQYSSLFYLTPHYMCYGEAIIKSLTFNMKTVTECKD